MAIARHVALMTKAGVAAATYVDGEVIEDFNGDHGVAYINLSAISGTSEDLNVEIQGYDPTSKVWFKIASITELTAAGKERLPLPALHDVRIRASAVVGGTGVSATFTISITLKDSSSFGARVGQPSA